MKLSSSLLSLLGAIAVASPSMAVPIGKVYRDIEARDSWTSFWTTEWTYTLGGATSTAAAAAATTSSPPAEPDTVYRYVSPFHGSSPFLTKSSTYVFSLPDSSTIPAAAAAATSVSASDVKTANLAAHNALRAKYSVRRTFFVTPRVCSLTPTHLFSRLLISSGMRRSRLVPKSGLTSATTRTREDRSSISGTAKTSRLERDRTAPRTSSRYVFNPCWNRTMGQERMASVIRLESGGKTLTHICASLQLWSDEGTSPAYFTFPA